MKLKTNDFKIDWLNADSHFLFNPRDPSRQELKELAGKLPFFKSCIYIFSSSREKIYLLSKKAFLHSARAVNKHLEVQQQDRWLVSLPLFHVGGLSIKVRAFCGNFLAVNSALRQWDPRAFQQELQEQNISLCSLVPTQIYDLIRQNLNAPKNLRAVVAGADFVSPLLYSKARALGWPVLPSYGMTETCSQIACAPLESLSRPRCFPKMKLLKHIQLKKSRAGFKIKTLSLPTACFDLKTNKLYDPKDSRGWMLLPDKIVWEKNCVAVLGRKDEEIKIMGESVKLQKLALVLEELSQGLPGEYIITALPDPRQGFLLALVTNSQHCLQALGLIKKFNQKSLPFENIQSLYFVSEMKKTPLYKARRKEIAKQLGL